MYIYIYIYIYTYIYLFIYLKAHTHTHRVEPGYNDIVLHDTSPVASDIVFTVTLNHLGNNDTKYSGSFTTMYI